MAKLDLPDNLDLADRMVQHERTNMRYEFGYVGSIIGSGIQKPGNIAGLTIAACFILIVLMAYAPADPNIPRS